MITVSFESFDKKGLKPIAAAFDKAGLPVASIDADNKPKRESGYQVKSATLNLESGQTVVLKAKAGGSLYQAKLNGKLLAIKDYLKADDFVKEVIAYAKENEPAYQKQKAKQMEKVKVAVPRVKAVNATVAEQTTAFQTHLAELQGQTEGVKAELETLAPVVAEKQSTLSSLQSQIAAENAKSDALQKELEGLQAGIMESANDGQLMETQCPECGAVMDDCEDGKCCPVCGCRVDSTGAVMESAGTAPVQIDRTQIAQSILKSDSNHPALHKAFVEGFNNSCSIEDAILFINSFTDEEISDFLKKEENILECAECGGGWESTGIGGDSQVTATDCLAGSIGTTYALRAKANFGNGDTTILSPIQYTDPITQETSQGACPSCGAAIASMEVFESAGKTCPACGMVLEAVGQDISIDRSGTHDVNDPAHVDDPDHENYGDKARPCPWCGSDVREDRCIQCNRQLDMAKADRAAWIAANKPLPADDFPSQYE